MYLLAWLEPTTFERETSVWEMPIYLLWGRGGAGLDIFLWASGNYYILSNYWLSKERSLLRVYASVINQFYRLYLSWAGLLWIWLMINFGAAVCFDRKRTIHLKQLSGEEVWWFDTDQRLEQNYSSFYRFREQSWDIPGFTIQEQAMYPSCLITQKQSRPSLWCRCCGLMYRAALSPKSIVVA